MLKQGEEIIIGPGDDCAAINIEGQEKLFLTAVDQLISDVHYNSNSTTPERIAAKLLKRNISDIAAMGGYPTNALLTIATNNMDENWLKKFFTGLSTEAEKWNVSICGGDISSLKEKNIFMSTLTINGWVKNKNICTRTNAKLGEMLYATGSFGNSYLSEHHLDFTPRIKEAEFLAGNFTRTMIDVSDGLLIDLLRVAEMSNVSIILNIEDIPRRDNVSVQNALADGEDYELLFTVPENKVNKMLETWPFKNVKLTKLGVVTEEAPARITNPAGENLLEIYQCGYDHLADLK